MSISIDQKILQDLLKQLKEKKADIFKTLDPSPPADSKAKVNPFALLYKTVFEKIIPIIENRVHQTGPILEDEEAISLRNGLKLIYRESYPDAVDKIINNKDIQNLLHKGVQHVDEEYAEVNLDVDAFETKLKKAKEGTPEIDDSGWEEDDKPNDTPQKGS